MLRSILILVLTSVSLVAFSQVEVCNNGIDDDFDGFIDCYDGSCSASALCDGIFLGNDATCQTPPPAFPAFTMTKDFYSPDESTNHLSRIVIGDLDRNGIPEMVTMNRYTKTLSILNGSDGSIQKQITVAWEPYWEIAIANLDNDNCAEIFFIGYQDPPGNNNAGTFMFAYDCTLTKIWETAERLPGDPINFGIADFDGDGKEEIYAKDEIYDAKTGIRIIKSTAANYSEINGGPVAVNITGDIKQELVIGLAIYNVNLGTRAKDVGSLTLVKTPFVPFSAVAPNYFIRDVYNATSIADYNLDGFLDVLASGSTNFHDDNTTVFFWDVQNNVVKTYSEFLSGDYDDGWKNGTGRLNVSDLDGDGKMNVSYVSGKYLYALKEDFTKLWRVTINEETSGYTGCTLFDFNGDGKAEIVYRDERYIYIIEGTDGSIYSQLNCSSRTNREYPIVADVDADGSTEICVTCAVTDITDANFNDFVTNNASLKYPGHIRVFKSAAEPWVPARRVWNQHGYFVVNVNDDLTIPTTIQAHQLIFSTGSCTVGPNRPLNKFLNQSPFLNSEGCPTYAAPDIAFSVAPTIVPPTCPNLNFTVSFVITNLGDVSITGDIPITFYTTNPKNTSWVKLNTITATVNKLKKGDVFAIDNATVTGVGADSVYVVLNDAGTSIPNKPIQLPNTTFFECDYDNIIGRKVIPLPVSLTALEVTPNESCSGASTGSARAFIPIGGGGENTADYNFYWSNGVVAKPIASADYIGPIYSSIGAGTYAVYARHKTANCNSDTVQVVINSATSPLPNVTVNALANQTSCVPANGQLQAVITGGSAGFTIDWYDVALNPLGISGPTASNLAAGSYLVIITKGSCNKSSAPVTITGPLIPDAQGQVLLNVSDCSNPNSGSVQADALFNGVTQNPTNYSFDWYYFNTGTNTQGSILPPANGVGQTRTGLGVGNYQAVVKDNATGCIATAPPIAVTSNTVIPTAQITQLSPQTSCNPASPNGILQGDALVGGVVQDPAGFTFQWFKGQNTLPANLVTTVSGVNGKVVNNVAGGGIPYTLKVTTALNCSATIDFTIAETLINPVVTLTPTDNQICNPALASGTFTGSVAAAITYGGVPVVDFTNYSFAWHDGSLATDPAPSPNSTTKNLIQQDGGQYTLVVTRTDLACVSNPVTSTINNTSTLPVLTTGSTSSSNCVPGLANGVARVLTVNGTAVGALANHTYQWHTGIGTGSPIAVGTNPTATSATLSNVQGGAANNYTALVTNTVNGCQTTGTVLVADAKVLPIVALAATDNGICDPRLTVPAKTFSGKVTASITNQIGALTDYSFAFAAGMGAGVQTANVYDQLNGGATAYTAIATHIPSGCVSSQVSIPVANVQVVPVLTTSTTPSTNCVASFENGQAQVLTVDGTAVGVATGYTYAWTGPLAPAFPVNAGTNTSNTAQLIKLQGGAGYIYTALVTNQANGCQTSVALNVADTKAVPVLTLSKTNNTVCNPSLTSPSIQFDGKVQVTGVIYKGAPYALPSILTYNFYNNGTGVGAAAQTGVSTDYLNQSSGTYSSTVTINDLGCTSNVVSSVINDNFTFPSVVTSIDPSTNCVPLKVNGAAHVNTIDGLTVGVDAAAITDYTYQWFDGATADPLNIKAGKTSTTLGSTVPGSGIQGGTVASTFTVLATRKSNGCQGNAAATITDAKASPVIKLSVNSNNTICDQVTFTPNGSLHATVTYKGVTQPSALAPNWVVTWSTTATGENLNALSAANYSASVSDINTGCASTSETETIVDQLDLPVITTSVIDKQTSCNVLAPNGRLQGSATNGPALSTLAYTWHLGIGTGAAAFVTASGQASGATLQTASNRISADYTFKARNQSTGCESTQTIFLPQQLTYPDFTGAVTDVTSCVPTNGVLDITLTTITNPSLFTIFYLDEVNFAQTGDPAVVKAIATTNGTVFTNDPSKLKYHANPPVISIGNPGLVPGTYTVLVRDGVTQCESNAVTFTVDDNTNKTITAAITGVATACSAGIGGELDLTVTPAAAYTFAWHTGLPTNSNFNFMNNANLPTFGGGDPVTQTTEDLTGFTNGSFTGVGAGIYTVVVTDAAGCGKVFSDNIPFLGAPAVALTLTNSSKCDPLLSDAEIQVQVTGTALVQYSVSLFKAGVWINGEDNGCANAFDDDGDGLSDITDTDCFVQNGTTTFTNTSALLTGSPSAVLLGDYVVRVFDTAGGGCAIEKPLTLETDPKLPQVSALLTPSTVCAGGVGDGTVQLTVNKNALDPTTPTYQLSSISPANIGGVANQALTTNAITAVSGTFNSQAYRLTVTDIISGCEIDKFVNIPSQPGLPTAFAVTPTDDQFCAPSTNGSALVSTLTGPAGNFTNYTFEWYNSNTLAPASLVFPIAFGDGSSTGGELLTAAKVIATNPANWQLGVAGNGNGNKTFYTRAQKQGGIGDKCYSPVAQVNISDKHSAPQITLLPFSNTSCNVTPEGRIEILTATVSGTPAIANSLYTYTWAPDPAGGNATPIAGQNGAAIFTITSLPTNTYTITALNQTNACLSTNSTGVLDTKFNISITDNTKIDQINCPIDGQIDVTEITIDRAITGEVPLVIPSVGNLSTDFTYQWFKAPSASPGTFNNATPLQDAVGPTTINVVSLVDGVGAQQYPSMGIGTYYVVATRTATAGLPGAGCTSLPLRVDVGDQRVFPALAFETVSNTSCNTQFDGSITVTATTTGFGAGTLYNFDWTSDPGGAVVIADATGVVSAPAFLSEALGGPVGQRIGPGAYGLTVTNTLNQCTSSGSVTLLQNTVPVEIVAGTGNPLTHCTIADGGVAVNTVNVDGIGAGLGNFSFGWTGNGGPYTGTNVSNLARGDYFVTATKTAITTKASGCLSAPFKLTVEDQRKFPLLAFTTLPSTSCDTNFDGQISLTATTTGFPNTTNYNFDWTSSPVGSTITDAVTQSPYTYQAGDIVGPGTYLIAVTNQTNACVSTGTISMLNNPEPIDILTASVVDQAICYADGSITVNTLSLGVPADYSFAWFRNVSTGSALVDGANAVITTSLLDENNYPTMGSDVYFVTATRNASSLPGSGCKTPPFLVEVKDNHVDPTIQFIASSNSSCNNLLPNGTILANAAEQNGLNTDTYSFNWTLNGLALPGVTNINNTTNSSQLGSSREGNYVLTVMNTSNTGCTVAANLNLLLDQTKSTPNIIDLTTVDPLDCNPNASATVTKITIGSTTNSLLFPPNVIPNNEITGASLLNFNYEWYQGSFNPANQLPIGGPFATTPTITSLLSGNYFVIVHDPTTDCKSGPKEVLIKGDNIIYPVLEVTQTMKQISCIALTGTASLAATADGQTDTNANYDFTWFNNINNSLPTFASTSTIANLMHGEYSITVLDKTTACTTSAPYIIKDDSREFTPVVSVGGQPRTLCTGIDGSVLARVANLDPTYPFPYDATTFTASLFLGATPDLSGPPEIPSMPFVTGFFTSVLQGGLSEGAYTVRITDNNSGCVGVATHEVEDARIFPALEISEIAPITNCDPTRPNGVARVLASGTFVGFQFDWYEGAVVTGVPIYTGVEYGELKATPQQYIIRGTDLASGCTSDIPTSFTDGAVSIPAPTIEKLSDVTSCVISNGALTAYVGADKNTKDYILSWYDGTVENPPADLIGETYAELAAGNYSVTATSKITGCKSPLKIGEVNLDQMFPDFAFIIQNTTCDKNDGFASLIMTSNTPVERIEWSNDLGPFLTGPNFSDAAYGTYTVTATTFLGCATTKDLEIKPDIRPYNGISRNNDGQNEIFMIDCIQEFPNNVVQIFNRAGTLVYEAQGYDNSSTFFDGKSNKGISPMGVDLPDGTYYYIVDKREGSKPIAGYLEILN